MRMAVAGGTGWVGKLVVERAREQGHEVVVISRSSGVDLTGGAWVAYNAIHFRWHMLHLHVFPTVDKIGVAVLLGGLLILSILMLLPVKATQQP